MKKVICRLFAIILYLLALIFLCYYFKIELDPLSFLSNSERLIIICTSCISIYMASILLSLTLDLELRKKVIKITFMIFLFLYIILLITLTLFDQMFRHFELQIFNIEEYKKYIEQSFNIIPFKTITYYVIRVINNNISIKIFITNIVGNMIAFMPFAFFLPLFWKKINNFKTFTITMIVIVLGVEILQFLGVCGVFDIDDVILNVSGACIMYMLLQFNMMKKWCMKITFNNYDLKSTS